MTTFSRIHMSYIKGASILNILEKLGYCASLFALMGNILVEIFRLT